MNALNRFAEIADLVNTWADRMVRESEARIPPAYLAGEMRAFSNELRSTVAMFRPVVEAAEQVVAERNVAQSKLALNAAYGKGQRDFNCRRYTIEHEPHPWTLDDDVYYCDGEGFTARRTRHGAGYCLNPNHPDGCKYPEMQ